MQRSMTDKEKVSWQMVSMTKLVEKMASKSVHLCKTINLYYRSIIRREIALADIRSTDHVLFIGGGPCPCSAILIHEMTGARVTVIDYDISCINCSHNLINKLGYSESIRSICKNGSEIESLQSMPYTVILVAAQVDTLDKVFNRIRNKSLHGTKILVRIPKQKLKKHYYGAHKMILKNIPRTLHTAINNLESTCLYVKSAKTHEMDYPAASDRFFVYSGEAI